MNNSTIIENKLKSINRSDFLESNISKGPIIFVSNEVISFSWEEVSWISFFSKA